MCILCGDTLAVMKKIDQEVITAQHVNLEELEGQVQLDKVKKKKSVKLSKM